MKFDDNRGRASYGAMLLVKEPGEQLYSLLVPSEAVPSIFGTPDTFPYDLLQSPTKGVIEGKDNIEPIDIEFFWHRDNVYRLEKLQNKVLDFLDVAHDFTARAFSGTLRVRPNDKSADIEKGTCTIIPNSAKSETLMDCRDLIKDTVLFQSTIPWAVTVTSSTQKFYIETEPFLTTLSVTCDNNAFSATVVSPVGTTLGELSLVKGNTPPAGPQYGIVYLTATYADMASWTTTIAVEY